MKLSTPYSISLSIPSRVDFVSMARTVVVSGVASVDTLSADRLDDLRWVVSEAVTNAIEANLAVNPEAQVHVDCEILDSEVKVSVTDAGSGMPDLSLVPSIGDLKNLESEGSMGIPLIKHLTSDYDFSSNEQGTTVRMELRQVS